MQFILSDNVLKRREIKNEKKIKVGNYEENIWIGKL